MISASVARSAVQSPSLDGTMVSEMPGCRARAGSCASAYVIPPPTRAETAFTSTRMGSLKGSGEPCSLTCATCQPTVTLD